MPEVRKCLKKHTIMEVCQRNMGVNRKLVIAKAKLSEQQNKVILGYNPKYKINIHEFILL